MSESLQWSRFRVDPVRGATRVILVWLAIVYGVDRAVAEGRFGAEWPQTDFSERSIDLAGIVAGGPPKDGIPAIDAPRFVTPAQASDWLDPREPVIGVVHAGDARAYPLQILIWHEIVNDTVGGRPLAVTFCPLCNAAIVFDRRMAGRVLDFGTSGLLRHSNLVMYDRQTESWWQQFTGRAIVGELNGTVLEQVPAGVVSFAAFTAAHPGAKVLSRDTGHGRAYGHNPYRGYDHIDSRPFLLKDAADPRLPAMERVLGITHGDRHRLYPFSVIRRTPVINDRLGAVPVVVLSRAGTLSVLDAGDIRTSRTIASATAYRRELDGRVLHFESREAGLFDRETGSRWNLLGTAVAGPLQDAQLPPLPGGVHFAFAWLAFRPESEIYTP
jgi:hypothetical protein